MPTGAAADRRDSTPDVAAVRRALRCVEPALVLFAVLGAWELLTRADVLPKDDIPPITAIVSELAAEAQTREMWTNVFDTLRACALGLGIAIAAAIPIGVVFGYYRPIYRSVRLLVEFIRPIPMVALMPLLVLTNGTGLRLAIVLVAFTAFWPILVQTMYGVQDVDPVARDTGHVYGLGPVRQFGRIVVPSALPYIVTGVRLAAALALVVAVAASLVAGGTGIGAAISSARNSGNVALMYARILVTGLLGLAVTALIIVVERRLLHWHPAHRNGPT